MAAARTQQVLISSPKFSGGSPATLVLMFALVAGCHAAVIGLLQAAAQSSLGEYQVKAAFIFHFAQMVDWPANSLPPNGPLVICTIDDNSYSAALDSAVDGKQIGEHPVQTRHLRGRGDFRGCHLLAIIGQDRKRAAALVALVKDSPVLTVGDSDHFVADGGIIGLTLQDNKVRFDINLLAAQRSNFRISSQLLLLARNVIGNRKTG